MTRKYKSLLTAAALFMLLTLPACNDFADYNFTQVYKISGTVSGLLNGQNTTLLNNNNDPLSISSNAPFTFPTPIPSNENYTVTVGLHPDLLFYRCFVSNGSGIAASNITNIGVGCRATQAITSTMSLTNKGTDIYPRGIVADSLGNLYFTSAGPNIDDSSIRKIDSSGVVTLIAGSKDYGYQDGQGSAALFANPVGLTMDASGDLYVADANNSCIRKINNNGVVTTFSCDSLINEPAGVIFDKSGNLYVASHASHNIQRIDKNGVVKTIAGSAYGYQGYFDGNASAARFRYPGGIAFDSKGSLYIADSANHAIRKINIIGDTVGSVTTFAGSGAPGNNDGNGKNASFDTPVNLTIDRNDIIYVVEYDGNRIRKIDTNANVTTLAGGSPGAKDGLASISQFNAPFGITVDKDNQALYIGDTGNGAVRKITSSE